MTEAEIERVRELTERRKRLSWRLRHLEEMANSIVPMKDGLPRTPAGASRVERLATGIADMKDEMERLRDEIAEERVKLLLKLSTPELNAMEFAVMSLRYVECLTFLETAFRLDKSEARIYQIHSDALRKIKVAL